MSGGSHNAPVLAIDGPSGSGKGTVSQRVAEALGWHLLDSGAIYRVVAVAASRHGVSVDDEEALADLARGLDVAFEAGEAGMARILLEGDDVTDQARSEAFGELASRAAALPGVREALLQRQRDFRKPPGLVADGRDMGSVVFPDAEHKVFLTASRNERARRRYNQLRDKGLDVNLADLLGDIVARDERDRNRAVAPLQPAPDAVVIDTTGLSIEAVTERVLALVGTAHGSG